MNNSAEPWTQAQRLKEEGQRFVALKQAGRAQEYAKEQSILRKIGFQTVGGLCVIGLGLWGLRRFADFRKRTIAVLGLLQAPAFAYLYPTTRVAQELPRLAESERSVYADVFCPDILASAHAALEAGAPTTPAMPLIYVSACRNYMERRKQRETAGIQSDADLTPPLMGDSLNTIRDPVLEDKWAESPSSFGQASGLNSGFSQPSLSSQASEKFKNESDEAQIARMQARHQQRA